MKRSKTMETLGEFLARCPDAKGNKSTEFIQRCANVPYRFNRREFPQWYLTGAQHNSLFRNGYPQREMPAGFFYDRKGHRVIALYDCKVGIERLLKSTE